MNRTLKLSMLMALALGSNQVMALDLGQVQVKSSLGQPLLAEIPLTPDNPAELRNITVQLASSEQFARAGIVGGRTAIPLHFAVANAAGGAKVIRITSSVAVNDPYLDLLIEVNSRAGKSVREFAILLDPPNSRGMTSAPIAAAPTRAAPSRPVQTQPAAPAPVSAAAPPAAASTKVSNGQYGPVAHGETLSGIARSTAPSGVDVRQMMLALQQANPDAFYRNNINALKSGAVLRVPTQAEAQSMTLAAALAEVRRQNSDWRASAPGNPTVVANAATRAATASGNPADNSDRLALVPAKQGAGAGSQGTGKSDKAVASMRQDLLRAKESVASLQQQSSDLKTRLKDLNDINSKNEHLLSLKDSEIAELQAKLAAARKAAASKPAGAASTATAMAAKPVTAASAAPPASGATLETATVTSAGTSAAPASAGSAAMAMTPPAGAASTASITAATSATSAVSTTPATVPAKPESKPAVRPAPRSVIEQPWYMQTWAWGAAGAALLLLIVLALLGRRRKPAAAAKIAPSLADRFGSAPSGDMDDLLGGEDVDQEELLDQLAEHPDDIGLHLELVTLYYSRRDVEHFEAAAEAMHAHITDPEQDEWQDVLHMGEDLVPAHPLFDHHAEAPPHEDADSQHEFDIDDYTDESDAPTVVSSMPPLPPSGPKKVSEYNFNFDLTTPSSGSAPADHPAAPRDHSVAPDDATVVAPLVADGSAAEPAAAESNWQFDQHAHDAGAAVSEAAEFSDDPVDTKLDLARAYIDMGDAEGARAMLGEVLKEGSQIQHDVAKRLLDSLR